MPPLPWYPPSSRGAWPVKYTKEKDQTPSCEGHYVWAANPSEISRPSILQRGSLDLFAGTTKDSSVGTTPAALDVKNMEIAPSVPAESLSHSQSEYSTNKLVDEVKSQIATKSDSLPEKSHIASKDSGNSIKVEEIQTEEHQVPTGVHKADRSRETSDESHTLSAHSEWDHVEDTKAEQSRETSEESPMLSAPSELKPDSSSMVQDTKPNTTHEAGNIPVADTVPQVDEKPTSPAPKARPALWTGLFKPGAASAFVPATKSVSLTMEASSSPPSAAGKAKSESLADALHSYAPGSNENKVAFLKPRGLVNTGNMCYMNSVLQVLVFCVPFYDFVDQLGKRSAHRFKNDTPLVEAIITFIREFKPIYSAESPEKVRLALKDKDIELYGEPFTPDYIYEAIKNLPRFKTMQRGHQQDAEEFLGFLLDGLHEECAQTMQSSSTDSSALATPVNRPATPSSESGNTDKDGDWQQVGPKQKSAVTRSSGAIKTSSPITKIFGGTLRSEFRVPGRQNSITTQPFRTLPLEISSPQVNNVVEALKYLARSEIINGDFKGPRNAKSGVKQFTIETLPQVLILHLKRFTYNNAGYTQKIGKKVGYPLELELPKEVFSRQQQQSMLNHGGLPKYRLVAVVYHHGKNASGGHYTVDVRRQDGREWIRLDDTLITRVRSEDVAEGGSEEDPKVLAAAVMAYKHDPSAIKNPFSGMDVDGDDEDDDSGSKHEWRQVNGSSNSNGTGKSWSAVANGATTPRLATAPKSKAEKFSLTDKVAYLLFFQKI